MLFCRDPRDEQPTEPRGCAGRAGAVFVSLSHRFGDGGQPPRVAVTVLSVPVPLQVAHLLEGKRQLESPGFVQSSAFTKRCSF